MALIARRNKEINLRVAGRSENLGGQTEREGHLKQGNQLVKYFFPKYGYQKMRDTCPLCSSSGTDGPGLVS